MAPPAWQFQVASNLGSHESARWKQSPFMTWPWKSLSVTSTIVTGSHHKTMRMGDVGAAIFGKYHSPLFLTPSNAPVPGGTDTVVCGMLGFLRGLSQHLFLYHSRSESEHRHSCPVLCSHSSPTFPVSHLTTPFGCFLRSVGPKLAPCMFSSSANGSTDPPPCPQSPRWDYRNRFRPLSSLLPACIINVP